MDYNPTHNPARILGFYVLFFVMLLFAFFFAVTDNIPLTIVMSVLSASYFIAAILLEIRDSLREVIREGRK